jgi:hypothetical protein
MQLQSTLTCPVCGYQSLETMPTDACQFFYDCRGCASVSPRKLAIRSNPEPRRWNSVFVGVPGSDIRKKPSLQHGANVKTGTPETTAWTGHRSMFQLFLRARAHNFFTGRGDNRSFKARSTDRDIGTDRSRVGAPSSMPSTRPSRNNRVSTAALKMCWHARRRQSETLLTSIWIAKRWTADIKTRLMPKLPMANAGCRSLRRRSLISGF